MRISSELSSLSSEFSTTSSESSKEDIVSLMIYSQENSRDSGCTKVKMMRAACGLLGLVGTAVSVGSLILLNKAEGDEVEAGKNAACVIGAISGIVCICLGLRLDSPEQNSNDGVEVQYYIP